MNNKSIIVFISVFLGITSFVTTQVNSVVTIPRPSWSTGVALYSFKGMSFIESLKEARKVGAKFVEGYSFQKLGNEFDNKQLLDLSDAQIDKMKKLLRAHDIKMISLYAAARTRDEWRKYFEIGHKLRMKFLVGEPKLEDLEFIDSVAGRYKLRLAIHNHAKNESKYWDPSLVLSVITDKEHIGVCADIGHWARSGLDPVENIDKLKGHILSIHAKNVSEFGNAKAIWVNLSHGVIDYATVLKALQKQRYHGMIYIEDERNLGNNSAEVASALNYLSGILQ